MKQFKSIYLFLWVITACATLSLSSCKKDPTPTPAEINKAILTGSTWKISSVKVDGVDQTAMFTGFTLTFTAGNYSTVKGGAVWPASGTWAFKDANAMSISRDNNLDVTVTTITETSLVLSLVWNKTTLGQGRTSSIAGTHVFTFTK